MPARVCIVGAGASGLACLAQCLQQGLNATVFEARGEVGGAWLFTDDPGPCRVSFDVDGQATASSPGEGEGAPAPTPMYNSLRTNVPTTLMQYRGCPFPPDVPLFADSRQVLAYLNDSSQHLHHHIHFRSCVSRLRWTTPADGGDQRKWLVETTSPDALSAPSSQQFDFVALANGHYAKTYLPFVDGLQSWPKEILHTRWYRSPDAFLFKTVLVVGNSASGYDITREIAMSIHERRLGDPAALLPNIYQSARSPSALGIPFDDPTAPDWAREITVFPSIVRVQDSRLYFDDGRTLDDVDLLIFATGYLFSFPFAHSTDAPFDKYPLTKPTPLPSGAPRQVSSEGGLRVHNLDARDLFYLPDPTLALLCLPYLVIPFPLSQIQSRLATKHWVGQITLSFSPGTPEEEEEARAPLVWGHPRQYDAHDAWLKEMEEGEVGTGLWAKTPQAIRDLRKGAKGLRRAVLGY